MFISEGCAGGSAGSTFTEVVDVNANQPFIFGPPPLGTFTLNATVVIDHVGAP